MSFYTACRWAMYLLLLLSAVCFGVEIYWGEPLLILFTGGCFLSNCANAYCVFAMTRDRWPN